MLYLLNKDVRTVRWNGEPLHEATSAIVKETMNGDFTLTVKYPISDSGIYQLIQEDMLIKAPTPVLGAQLFRIKKPVEHNDHLEITAYHISDDVMKRSITPVSVTSQSCGMALSRMVQNTKTALGDFSFSSDIQDRRTFNTTETETLYSVLLDGKHSIVGTWEGELVRDNFAMTVKKSRGENRGVVITTHKNLKDYQRTKNSQNVVTRIHAKSTFKPEGADKETTIRVTVDSPLINSYPYINEKEYENNNAKTIEELQKWAQAKFSNEGIDKVSDAIKIEAYELDGQVVHMGDTVNLKSLKHNVDVFKEAIAYEFDALKEEYISLTFDDKAGTGGSRASGGLSSAADAILGVTGTAQEIALEKALQNADLDFDHKAGLLRQEILDGIELAKARAEEVKKSLTETIDQRFRDFDSTGLNEIKQKADEALKNAGAGSLLAQEAKQISEQARQQMDSKFAEYKQSVDGRFTSLSSRLDGKANLIDFQRVQETSQLYELILGTTENGIADKVARMAMTSQLFQVEVAKNVGDSRNYVRNADFRDGSKNWRETNVSGLNFNYEHSSQNRTKSGVHIYGTSINARYFGLQQTFKIELKKSDKITLSFLVSKDGYNTFSGVDVGLHYRKDGAIKSQAWKSIPNSDITASAYKKLNFNYELPVDVDEINLMFYGQQGKSINLYISEIKLETGSNATLFTLAPEDTDEAVRTVQNQLAGSWAIQNLTNAGSIVSQINATSNQILIEAEKIRLKGKTLLDELTAIDGYFKRLFVGEGNFAKLNAEIIGTNTITADKLVMDIAMARRFVSSDIFTDTLAAKEAFINKLRSVVVSATLLEGYKGKIGGFQIGTHDKDPKAYWLTGQNQFEVGMSNGNGNGFQTALWVNWGNDWDKPGIGAWFVKNSGEMYCYRPAHFWNTPVIHGNLEVTGDILYYNKDGSGVSVAGKWMYSSEYTKIERSNGYLYLYRGSNGYNWIPLNKEISDRRYKSNIKASTVSGLDVIENLKTYSYRKEYDGKIEDISCGIMAQDVQKYVPEAFFENPDGAYSYRTFELVPYLIKAIQELNQKIEKLEKTA
ncbi:phage tail spike protein [Streptococcus oralis]|uniref:phage tail spike protein n=1 Tax=Streptococcus oralis TaxID=1303 RepID=UPI0020014092|nr:phage tail spike protein [Streptococcus oralis]